jgi:hypothetical protein
MNESEKDEKVAKGEGLSDETLKILKLGVGIFPSW